MPVSGRGKVWRFEITADTAATGAVEPAAFEGFDKGGATFVAGVFGLVHNLKLVGWF